MREQFLSIACRIPSFALLAEIAEGLHRVRPPFSPKPRSLSTKRSSSMADAGIGPSSSRVTEFAGRLMIGDSHMRASAPESDANHGIGPCAIHGAETSCGHGRLDKRIFG